jgi:hypothetical protein
LKGLEELGYPMVEIGSLTMGTEVFKFRERSHELDHEVRTL